MSRKLFFSVAICLGFNAGLQAQKSNIDTIAVAILDRMSLMIGDLNACHVTVKSNYDIQSQHLGLVKHSDEEQLYMQGPDKLLIRSAGDRGDRNIFYNGKSLSYFSVETNRYSTIPLAVPIMEMIDTVHKLYNIDFPAADFFYPTFVDDLLAESQYLIYLGMTKIEGKDCFHIAGKMADKSFQFWISDDGLNLPMKMVIVYTSRNMNPQYEAVLSDWQLNPLLPPALFEFIVPPKAKTIKLAPIPSKK